MSKKKTILIVPLDWGLGHATRCIPLIKEFRTSGFEVIIAGDTALKSLFEHEFQCITFIPLEGYRIRYSKSRYWLPIKIISQVPRILLRIYREHQWIKRVVKDYSIDAIIADNRFGLYHAGVKSVYITHQLLIKTGRSFTEKITQRIHFWFIKKYSFCWVPDFETKENIAGELSHPMIHPPNIKYIGCLSRFEKKETVSKKYDLLLLISGPEPQRSIFEQILLVQLQDFEGTALLVRGLPGIKEEEEKILSKKIQNPGVFIKNHLPSDELNLAILQSKLVISRSGYTTIMDLVKLGQNAILVPTPGQTEQEYLAWHLMNQQFFYATSQDGFILTDALKQTGVFPTCIPAFDMELYKKVIGEFAQSI